MPDQLAYPSATIDSTRGGPGGWFIVDPSHQALSEHEVLNDLDDATYVTTDGKWGGTRPSFLCRVQTLPGKLPLRRPYIGATKFALRVRYRISGSGGFTLGARFDIVDYAGDHPSVASVPAPGRRTVIASFNLSGNGTGGAWVETEFAIDSTLLKGHDPIGWRAVSDLGVYTYAPQSTIIGPGPQMDMAAYWVAVSDVERHSDTQADWKVIREPNGTWSTQDVKGNWPGGTGAGQKFTTLFGEGSVLNFQWACVDAGRRVGYTKPISGTAIVEIDPSVFTGQWSNVANQPNMGGFTIGKNGNNRPYIYWNAGSPSSPGALIPVDGLIIRAPVVPDAYRNGNDRPSLGTLTIGYDYDGAFVEHGTISFYGFRFWSTNGGISCIASDNAGGKPNHATRLDLHDYQLTGPVQGPGFEFQRGTRMGGLRFDYRKGYSGRSGEHAYYQTTPTGDSQLCQAENIFAAFFYPKHTGASSVSFNGFDFHQFVMRSNSCTNNGNPPGCTPQGRGVLLVEDCIGRNGNGGDFKVAHSLGTYINRRCTSQDTAAASGQAAIRCTAESFGNVGQAITPVPFGADFSLGTFDHWQPTTCTKHGGSGLPNPAQPYPAQVPGNADAVYCFEKVVIEDLTVSGTFGDTVVQISAAKEIIIDRGNFSGVSKRPLFGFWYWNWDGAGNVASWMGNGQGPFDNKRVEFRNVGPSPTAYYGTTQLVAYGARDNPKMDGWTGTPQIPYVSSAKLQLLTVAGNKAWPPWLQTQRIAPGGSGTALGHSNTYPCVSAPDFNDPAIYGGYFGNDRRYPNKNTVRGAVVLTKGADPVSVTTSSGGAAVVVTVGDSALTKVADPVTVFFAQVVQVGDSPLTRVADPVTVSKPVVVALTSAPMTKVADAVTVILEDVLDFSLTPAILELSVVYPSVLTDIPPAPSSGDGSSDATSLCGAAAGRAA